MTLQTARTLWTDEGGFILSAELVLVSTILVIGLIVGMTELQCSVVAELNDLGEAIGSLNQSFCTSTTVSFKQTGQIKAICEGSSFYDHQDGGDGNECALICALPVRGELPKFGANCAVWAGPGTGTYNGSATNGPGL